jgi:hypothetical protein
MAHYWAEICIRGKRMDKPTRRLNADDLPPKGSGDSLTEQPCLRCGTLMVSMVVMGLYTDRFQVVNPRSQRDYLFWGERGQPSSPAESLVCPECGYIELFATEPHNLTQSK